MFIDIKTFIYDYSYNLDNYALNCLQGGFENMDWIETLFFWIEILGIVAASISGALVAMERGLDLFGVYVLSSATALGGGIIRDLIIGRTPPVAIRDPEFFIVTFIGTTIFFIITNLSSSFFKRMNIGSIRFLFNLSDATGLGIFCVIGVNAAYSFGYSDNRFLAIFTGVITGIGGGMLRDLLANRTPVVLRKEIYALAALVGCILYSYLYFVIPKEYAMLTCILIIISLRMISLKFKLGVNIGKKESGKIFIKFFD